MNLGQAKEKLEHGSAVPFDPAGAWELVDAAHRHAKEALVELRDIARGIHPPALDIGLDAALATLVARSAVPATLRIDVSGDRRRRSKPSPISALRSSSPTWQDTAEPAPPPLR
jgi:signal transduction histidine kinase